MQEVFRLSLLGASRRCDNTVLEQLIRLSDHELAALPVDEVHQRKHIDRVLSKKGLVEILSSDNLETALTPVESLGWLYASLATGLQRNVLHRVHHVQLEPREDAHEFHAIFEYEYLDLGWRATRLAMAIVCEAFPGFRWPNEFIPPFKGFDTEWKEFRRLAAKTTLPVDTEAIIMAARRFEIPCIKLEREPYEGLKGNFRIRRNSMLKLGDCTHQLVLDGMLCIDRSQTLIGTYHDRMSLINLSEIYRFIIPFNQNKYLNAKSYEEAKQIADSLQYPLVVKPRRRSHGRGISLAIDTPGKLEAAVRKALTVASPLLLERYVSGSPFRLLLVSHTLIAVIASDGRDVGNITDKSITATATTIASDSGAGMMEMTVVTSDISKPLSATSGAVVDVDFSPRLDGFLRPGSEIMQRAVNKFLHWLYPADAPSRIPMVVITGTNGKTTTSRMAARILTQSGLITAMCCTDGVYRDGKMVERKADVTGDQYLQQLEDPDVQAVVLEAHFGRIARLGFPWQKCDVGVCTNVSRDHIGRLGTETLDDMAALKRSVLDRARHAVLNADDPRCIAMLPYLSSKLVTLTTLGTVENFDDFEHADELNICSIEDVSGRDWIVLTEKGQRRPVIAVNDIPATFDGSARYNISNAQQAVAATRAAKIPIKTIAKVLASFEMNIQNTPGRLNIHDNGRYKVIMDFAHNADGVKNLADFVDSLAVNGRRIIMFSVSMLASNELIFSTAAASAEHFDIYICWDSSDDKHRPAGEVSRLMRRGIEAQGVVSEAIKEVIDQQEALDYALALCRNGDLLVVHSDTGKFDETWKTILEAG